MRFDAKQVHSKLILQCPNLGMAQVLVTLPNGWQVPACSQAEAMFIYDEIVDHQCYLQEGIQINNGNVVMDIGANIGQCKRRRLGHPRDTCTGLAAWHASQAPKGQLLLVVCVCVYVGGRGGGYPARQRAVGKTG